MDALTGTPRTVTITGTTVSGYQRGGLVAFGDMMTMNVSGSTVGPPDQGPGLPAQNGVQYTFEGPGGTVSSSTIFGSGLGPSMNSSTAVLLSGADGVTLSGNTITGAGTDIGVTVSGASTNTLIENNDIGRTSADVPDSFGIGVSVSADSAAGTQLVCNTFGNWKTDIVGATQPLCISPPSLPDGRVGTPYSETLTAAGGTAPYTWSLESGSLPPGLTLSPAGVLTGIPTAAGTFAFTAEVTDATGATSSHAFTITIAPATSSSPPPTSTPSSTPTQSSTAATTTRPSAPASTQRSRRPPGRFWRRPARAARYWPWSACPYWRSDLC